MKETDIIQEHEIKAAAFALHSTFGLYRRSENGRKRRTRAKNYNSMDMVDVTSFPPQGMSEHRFERILTTRLSELSRMMRSDVDIVDLPDCQKLVVVDKKSPRGLTPL